MKSLVQSPWFAVSLGILGLILGYSVVIARSSDSLAATKYFCPAKEICQNGECGKEKDCQSGNCPKKCNCGGRGKA